MSHVGYLNFSFFELHELHGENPHHSNGHSCGYTATSACFKSDGMELREFTHISNLLVFPNYCTFSFFSVYSATFTSTVPSTLFVPVNDVKWDGGVQEHAG